MKIGTARQFFMKFSKIKFHENSFSGSQVLICVKQVLIGVPQGRGHASEVVT
jgi:hypothetical protein